MHNRYNKPIAMSRNYHQIMILHAVDAIEQLFLTYKEPHLLFLLKELLLENLFLLTVNKEHNTFYYIFIKYTVHKG